MNLTPCGSTYCEKCEAKDSCGGGCRESKSKPFYLSGFSAPVCPIYDCAVNKVTERILTLSPSAQEKKIIKFIRG